MAATAASPSGPDGEVAQRNPDSIIPAPIVPVGGGEEKLPALEGQRADVSPVSEPPRASVSTHQPPAAQVASTDEPSIVLSDEVAANSVRLEPAEQAPELDPVPRPPWSTDPRLPYVLAAALALVVAAIVVRISIGPEPEEVAPAAPTRTSPRVATQAPGATRLPASPGPQPAPARFDAVDESPPATATEASPPPRLPTLRPTVPTTQVAPRPPLGATEMPGTPDPARSPTPPEAPAPTIATPYDEPTPPRRPPPVKIIRSTPF